MAIAGTLAYSSQDPRNGVPDNDDGLQVLLVEDDAADAYLIKCALASNPRIGSITRVTDGLQALKMIEEGGVAPDLAIIDLQMPRMDGFRLLVELGVKQGAKFPRFVLTSSVAPSDRIRSKLRGADRVLSKPDTLKDLEVILRHAIASI
jgi:two-component system, chemotaxis family, sensor kinase CheA